MPKQKKQPESKPHAHAQPPKPPNWPPLRPLLPPTDLTLTPLLQDQIYLIHNFLPASLCKTYASFLGSLPLTTTPGKPKKDEAVRVNDRFQVEDARFAEMLWSGTALKELVTTRLGRDGYDESEDGEEGGLDGAQVEELARRTWGGEVLGLNPNIRIYRYSAGQFFAQHCMYCCHFPRREGSVVILTESDRRRIQLSYFPPGIRDKIRSSPHDLDPSYLSDDVRWRGNSVLPRAYAGRS